MENEQFELVDRGEKRDTQGRVIQKRHDLAHAGAGDVAQVSQLRVILHLPAADEVIKLDGYGHQPSDAGRGADRSLLLLAELEADATTFLGLGLEFGYHGAIQFSLS
jgi:hypothetical protein